MKSFEHELQVELRENKKMVRRSIDSDEIS